ncbi:hypothetical protein [Mycobacteroides sp. LB1]|uniref:hypothetical protein n=1 Tax=Mycobacteroides sp. LB1 TaxID=2750814 RepID=UPI0015DF2090|nr:hypothetical protein [Mycobacteroides sp. LB1]
MTPMKSPKTRTPVGIRRALAAIAVTAVAIAGWHLNINATTGIGVLGLPAAIAEPTGPPGPTGGMTDGGGSQFQPPQMPASQPEYQGGNNLPPLDQNSGINIYNSGAPQAGQQAGGQQPQQGGQQPQHGTQPPGYQTATPYTQGPGQANPEYQAPQQGNQPQQPQQGNQPQQPSQTPPPTQTGQPTQTERAPEPRSENSNDETSQKENGKNNTDQQCDVGFLSLAMSGAPLPGAGSLPAANFSELYTLSYSGVTGPPGGKVLNVDTSALQGRQLDAANTAIAAWKAAQHAVSIVNAPGEGAIKFLSLDLGLNTLPDGGTVIGQYKQLSNVIELNSAWLPTAAQDKVVSNIVHEMGHALGLAHSCPTTVMNANIAPSPPTAPTPMDIAVVRQRWS